MTSQKFQYLLHIYRPHTHTGQFESTHCTARLAGYLSEWAVLEEQCKNQRFNAQDGGTLSWDRFFHELGRWYGVEDVRGPEPDQSKYQVQEMPSGKDTPLGYGPPTNLRLSKPLQKWAEEPSTAKAWEDMMDDSHGQLKTNLFAGAGPDMFLGDFGFLPSATMSMNKARMFSFCGFVDTLESVFLMFTEMASMGILPPMKVERANPLL